MGAKATAMTNGSDNRLLVSFMDANQKCAALLAPDLTNKGRTMAGSVALNEIQASLLQQAPIALVSSMDPMVLTTADAAVSLTKQNLYRAQVNQPQVANAAAATADHLAFCQNYVTVGAASIVTDSIQTFGAASPAADAGKDLYTFLGQRWMMGFQGLTCDKILGIKNSPITANFDANMVCQNLTFPDQTFMGVNLFQLAQGCGLVDAKGVPTNKKPTACKAAGAGLVGTTTAPVAGGGKGVATSSAAAPAATTPAAPPAAAAGMDCVVTVPANAFTATGLSTPWQVTGCDQTATPTFVDCTIIDTATGALSVYYPLLVNKGAVAGKDFIAPTVPTLPAANQVMCHFGTNGMTTTLAGATAANNCVNGLPNVKGDIFGQFAACNAAPFWAAVNKAIAANQITAGAAGTAGTIAGAAVGGLTKGTTGLNGKPCYTTHSFELVDMDPSDNMMASFLQDANGKLAQNTTENIAAMGAKATAMTNGSDNRLLVSFMDANQKCAALLAPDLTNKGRTMAGSVALNEIQASLLQQAPIALVSSMDPMVLTTADAAVSLTKQNLYRAQVNQPQVANAAAATADHLAFCQNYVTVGAASIVTDSIQTFGATSPAADAGKDLYTFLGQRWMMGFQGLTCDKILGIKNSPITANFDANMVCQNLTFPDQTFMGVNLFQLAQGCGLVDAKGVPTNKKPTACKAAANGLTGATSAAAPGATSAAAPGKTTAAAAPAKSTAVKVTTTAIVAGGGKGAGATAAPAAPAAVNMDCVVTVPQNAFTAAGLATPWQVTGCDQTVTPTFVDCTIIDTATGALSVYYPLLVNKGAVVGKNFIAPT
ncbi:hypothetical protein HK101_005434, partial [Irineochytrium annulatum]